MPLPETFWEIMTEPLARGFSQISWLMWICDGRSSGLQNCRHTRRGPENSTQEEYGADGGQFHDRYVAPEMADWTVLYRSNQLLLLPTNVNGSMAKLFCVSLGSGISLISQEAAREVSTVTTDQFTNVRGLNGEVKNGHRSSHLKLQFAKQEFYADAFPVVGMSVYDENSFDVAGSLGFPALSFLDIKIDYRDGLNSLDNGKKRK
jgi:hypothetical protein